MNLYFGGAVKCTRRQHDIRTLYFDEDTLIRTLLSVRWMYFDEDTLNRTLLSVRWMYFDEDTLICTLLSVRWPRDGHVIGVSCWTSLFCWRWGSEGVWKGPC